MLEKNRNGFCFGKKTILNKNISLGWSLGSAFILSSTVPKFSGLETHNRNAYINERVRQYVADKNFFELKFEIGYLL